METIRVSNVGAIPEFSFKLGDYGVTALVGPQGVGKSTILAAVQSLASGKGKVPLRDGEKDGVVDGFGALMMISGKTTRSGEFEVEHLEGRFDLATLVDPGVASPAAADARRIKALVALTGVKGSPDRFKSRDEFTDLEQVVPPEALSGDDLVEQTARVKRAYEEAARKAEDQAQHEDGHAKGCAEAAEGLDLEAECDAIKLRRQYDAARDTLTTLKEKRSTWADMRMKAGAARQAIEAAELPDLEEVKAEEKKAAKQQQEAHAAVGKQEDEVALAERILYAAKHELELRRERLKTANAALSATEEAVTSAIEAHAHVAEQQALVNSFSEKECPVSDAQLTDAEMAVSAASDANDHGTLIREAKEKLTRAEAHEAKATSHRKQSEQYRSAAHATDHVLSDAIDCERLKVEAREGAAVLLAPDDEHGGEWVPFARLSDGQRWREAIKLGAQRVGEGGLLVIPQGAWGELSGKTRKDIHEFAREAQVYVLTAIATPKESDEVRGLEAVAFGGGDGA